MASGRINRNVLIYISGGSGCTPSEANTLVPTPMLTTAWVRGLTSDSILTADRRGGILMGWISPAPEGEDEILS